MRRNLWPDIGDERQRALRTILHNKGGMVTGAAGTGKSVGVLQPLRDELLRRGETVHVCAYTHAAARLVGGVTIARLLKFDARLHNAWIIVDEFSLIPIDTLGMLARMELVGAKFVLFGDPFGQFEPMRDRWDVAYSRVPNSTLLRDMCRCLRVHLTEYMRGTDQHLFDFYTGLYELPDNDLPNVVKKSTRVVSRPRSFPSRI